MAQKTFTQYLNLPRRSGRRYNPDEFAAVIDAANEARDAAVRADATWLQASREFSALARERGDKTAIRKAEAREEAKYRKRNRAATRDFEANLASQEAWASEFPRPLATEEEAARFNPQGPSRLEYSVQAYPSARGAEMGLKCPVFRVAVKTESDGGEKYVIAVALRNDGRRMGIVKAKLINADRDGTPLAAVSWSSLLDGGSTLNYDRAAREPEIDFRRCGVGPRLYEAIAAYACKNNRKMASDRTLLANSWAIWERQQNKGRAKYDTLEGRYIVLDTCGIKRTGMRGLGKHSRKSKRRKG